MREPGVSGSSECLFPFAGTVSLHDAAGVTTHRAEHVEGSPRGERDRTGATGALQAKWKSYGGLLYAGMALFTSILSIAQTADVQDKANLLDQARTLLFLGDSITYDGRYVEYFETSLVLCYPGKVWRVVNAGLPSETVSGLSEPGHANGAFNRPDLHERLERVLRRIRPNVVLACYGMNDGIYYPYDLERERRFQEGLQRLAQSAHRSEAKVVFLTPPVFDSAPIKSRTLPKGRDQYPQPFEGYDEVLNQYSRWLLGQQMAGWLVVDVHGPMREALSIRRRADPSFAFATDGVHPNASGHWLMARQLMEYFGVCGHTTLTNAETLLELQPNGQQVFRLVQQRHRILRDAWLTATGHKRPGIPAGRPLAEAEAEAQRIETAIRQLLRQSGGGANPPSSGVRDHRNNLPRDNGGMPGDPATRDAPHG